MQERERLIEILSRKVHPRDGVDPAVVVADYLLDNDIVPVVRCRDCKHCRNLPNGLCYLHTEPYDNERGYKGEAVCVVRSADITTTMAHIIATYCEWLAQMIRSSFAPTGSGRRQNEN